MFTDSDENSNEKKKSVLSTDDNRKCDESEDLAVEHLDKDDIFERMDEVVSYFPGQCVREQTN
jgi:hypothetical protein